MVDAVIPDFRAERVAVPGTYDLLRRPGSSGQRYFSDMRYAVPPNISKGSDEAQAVYNARYNTAFDTNIDAARNAGNTQAAGLQTLNSANLARQQRPPAQTLTDAEIKTMVATLNDPSRKLTERQQIAQAVGMMNQYNINPYRGSTVMNGLLSDVQAKMQPYYTAVGEDKSTGVADFLKAQNNLVSEARKGLPYALTPPQRNVLSLLNNADPSYVAKLINMGLFTPETAAQYYQTQYPGITEADVKANMTAMGYAHGGLASLAPQNQGYYLGGTTDGMADQIPATIDNKQPAALSDGEFVVPADVVSHLGNGNSDAGAKNLYRMMERVRTDRTGRAKQGRQINPNNYLV